MSTFEKIEEPISDETLVEAILRLGPKDEEVKRIIEAWTKQEELKVGKDHKDSIDFNIRRGRLYVKAKCPGAALDAFDGARRQAVQDGDEKLAKELWDEMDEIEQVFSGTEE